MKYRHAVARFPAFYGYCFSSLSPEIGFARSSDPALTKRFVRTLQDVGSLYSSQLVVGAASFSSLAAQRTVEVMHRAGEPPRPVISPPSPTANRQTMLVGTNARGDALPLAICDIGPATLAPHTEPGEGLLTEEGAAAFNRRARAGGAPSEESQAGVMDADEGDEDDWSAENDEEDESVECVDEVNAARVQGVRTKVAEIIEASLNSANRHATNSAGMVDAVQLVVDEALNCAQLYYPCAALAAMDAAITSAVTTVKEEVCAGVAAEMAGIYQQQGAAPSVRASALPQSRPHSSRPRACGRNAAWEASSDDDDDDDDDDDEGNDEDEEDQRAIDVSDDVLLESLPDEDIAAATQQSAPGAAQRDALVHAGMGVVKRGVSRLINTECAARHDRETGWALLEDMRSATAHQPLSETVGPSPSVTVFFSTHGRLQADHMLHYARVLRVHFDSKGCTSPMLLILEWDSCNRSAVIQRWCHSNRVSLLYVPPSATWACQPLTVGGLPSIRSAVGSECTVQLGKNASRAHTEKQRQLRELAFRQLLTSTLRAIHATHCSALRMGWMKVLQFRRVRAEHAAAALAAPPPSDHGKGHTGQGHEGGGGGEGGVRGAGCCRGGQATRAPCCQCRVLGQEG